MAKKKFERTKPHVNIGTIGHIDHGKTTLTSGHYPLSRKQRVWRSGSPSIRSTRPPKRRSVVSPSRPLTWSTRRTTVTMPTSTAPGHADYIKNMITGAAQMDGAILVVGANDGPMPQTREHILLARQVGVPFMVVYLNKVDMVDDPELIELVELELRELLTPMSSPARMSPSSGVQH